MFKKKLLKVLLTVAVLAAVAGIVLGIRFLNRGRTVDINLYQADEGTVPNEALTALTAEVKSEIEHLESIRTSLDLATNEGDLAQIRQELEDSGLVKRHNHAGSKRRPGYDKSKGRARTPVSKPLHYISSDGYDIYVGKNNTQNDQLTCKMAGKSDWWFHTQGIHGAHVILWTQGAQPDEQSVEEAAMLAAWYSQGRGGSKIPVDYTPVKFVKKPAGAKPGMVVYTTYRTMLVTPEEERVKQLGK
jgi:predicted ribosome quality control (RQC) complex YloA/Tae2 family protein